MPDGRVLASSIDCGSRPAADLVHRREIRFASGWAAGIDAHLMLRAVLRRARPTSSVAPSAPVLRIILVEPACAPARQPAPRRGPGEQVTAVTALSAPTVLSTATAWALSPA